MSYLVEFTGTIPAEGACSPYLSDFIRRSTRRGNNILQFDPPNYVSQGDLNFLAAETDPARADGFPFINAINVKDNGTGEIITLSQGKKPEMRTRSVSQILREVPVGA